MTSDPFWRGKRVLVTGATGLVGSWLTSRLLQEKADLVCLVRDHVPNSHFFRSGLDRLVTVVRGELEDYWTIERTLNEYDIDSVFHLGAQTIVGTANRSPLPTFEANIRGSWNLLEAARMHADRVRRVVVASSDKAYGDQAVLPYTEDMPLRGRHPYDVSKSATDLIAQAYAATYELPVAIARCGNIFGGGDLNFNRLIPGTIASALRGEPPVIRSDGTYLRDYIFVQDVVEAYLSLAEALDDPGNTGEAFNFSTDQPFTVRDITRTILRLLGREDLRPVVLGTATGEIRAQSLSSAKARSVLNWRPRYGVEAGLRETIDWYRQVLAEGRS